MWRSDRKTKTWESQNTEWLLGKKRNLRESVQSIYYEQPSQTCFDINDFDLKISRQGAVDTQIGGEGSTPLKIHKMKNWVI